MSSREWVPSGMDQREWIDSMRAYGRQLARHQALPASAWTDPKIEATLEVELGERALSWLFDINPYEYEPEDALAAIPGTGETNG